jgi:nucleotide-binding universal stress UspA family protein
MNPIVVAFGEHDHASPALQWAAEYSHHTGNPLEVLSVFASSSAEVSPDDFHRLLAERRQRVVDALFEVGADGSRVEIANGDTVDEIIRFVADREVDMVVIGTHHLHRRRSGGFGSPAHHLLHDIGAPVLLVTPASPALEHGIVVVGVDGSSANHAALAAAVDVAATADATLHAVFAYDPLDDTFTHPEGWHRHSDDVRAMVDKITEVPVKLYMAAGHPTQVLLEHAATESAALIVVGTRGHGGFASLRLGRVPAQLIAHTTTPLLVVPH